MLIQLPEYYRLMSNDSGGHNPQNKKPNKKNPKNPYWEYLVHLSKLDSMLSIYLQQLTPVANIRLDDAKAIVEELRKQTNRVMEAVEKL